MTAVAMASHSTNFHLVLKTDVNIFPDPLVKETKERISSGQGSDHPKETIRAGSSTSADTVSAGVASGAIDRG